MGDRGGGWPSADRARVNCKCLALVKRRKIWAKGTPTRNEHSTPLVVR